MPSSPTFNAICYLARYPDLRQKWVFRLVDGGWGYSGSGNHKGREQYKISDNPAKHFNDIGRNEGRVGGCDLPGTMYSNEFNSAAYLARYPDIKISDTWATKPLQHYQTYGIDEGRIPGYELITKDSPIGETSPGTTLIVNSDQPEQAAAPGDDEVYSGIDNSTDDTMDAPMNQSSGGDIMTWITANPIMTAAIAASVLIILHEIKKNKKRKRA